MKLIENFDIDLESIINMIIQEKATKVGLQLPEGFKRQAIEIAGYIEENTDAETLISGNPCYGACDLDIQLIKDTDLVFHFGHSRLEPFENVVYIEAPSHLDISYVVFQAADKLKGKRIGLLTTVQHVHKLEEVRKILEENGFETIIGKGDGRIVHPGQVLGCNFSAAYDITCEEYLYIGGGKFHPLGIALSTGKPVLCANPFTSSIEYIDLKKIMKQRYAAIAKTMEGKKFCILVSTKPGQERMQLARDIRDIARKNGKEAYIVTMDLITPDQLLQFQADAYVNTACPRIAIDEAGRFPAPMLTPPEFEIVLGMRGWEELVFDEIRE